MELKPGYKQTEVGVIPQEWEISSLGELSQFVTSGSRGWAAYYSDHGALFIRSQNVRAGHLDFDDTQFVQPPPGAEGNRTRVTFQDLLITITGNSVGNVALVEQDLGEAYISQHVGMVRLSEPKLAPYVCRFLSPGSPGNSQIWGSQSGQSKPGLTLQNLKDFRVAYPPTEEERRVIVNALRDVDRLLGGLDLLIAKKHDLKQATMQQLLTGQTRLPGFHGKWEMKTLGQVFEISSGKSKSAFVTDEGDFIICDMGSVSTEGRLISSKRTNFCGDFLRKGDLVMPKDDIGGGKIIGKVGYVDASETYVLGDHVYRLRALEGAPSFWAYLINSHPINGKLRKKVIGSAQLGLGRRSVEELEIPFPNPLEQTAIAEVMMDMDTELTALDRRREKTRVFKQAIMQELLTGKTRLI